MISVMRPRRSMMSLYLFTILSFVRLSCGKLFVSPDAVGMLGGEMLDLNNMILEKDDPVIKCRFGGDDNFVSYGYRVSAIQARCSVPLLTFRGKVKLDVSVDFQPYSDSTYIQVAINDNIGDTIHLPYNGPTSGWNETNTKELTVRWDGNKLTYIADAKVKLQLIGYRESSSEVEQTAVLYEIGETLAVGNTFTFSTDRKLCSLTQCTDFDVGFVKIELLDQLQANTHRYLIASTVLGFYVNKVLTSQVGSNWPSKRCKSWYEKDTTTMGWISSLPSCPCTLHQSLADFGSWQMDKNCNMYTAKECRFHIGAVHCVRSTLPTDLYAGNHCCYTSDGNLMYVADFRQGSSADRSHTEGTSPFKRPLTVPGLSHMVEDLAPYYYCCLWSDSEHCNMYLKQRPTVGCKSYMPSGSGFIFGQGHILTFDGTSQRMCGLGDFTILTTTDPALEKVTIQGRFMDKNPSVGQIKSRQLITIAVQVGLVDTLELRLKSASTVKPYHYLQVVYNNGSILEFDQSSFKRKDFEVTTIIDMETRTNRQGNFTIIIDNGMGIQVSVDGTTMSAIVMLPPSLKGKVDGLLGNFNDKQDVEGAHPPILTNALSVYENFQYKWGVNNSIMFLDVSPMKIPPGCLSTVPVTTAVLCNGNDYCNFDLSATGNDDEATRTMLMFERIQEIREFLKPVKSCGLLNIPGSIKSSYNYSLGNSVTVHGCQTGETLSSDTKFTCVATDDSPEWKPTPSPLVCTASEASVNSDVIIGVVIGLIAVAILIIIAVFVIRKFRDTERKMAEFRSRGDELTTSHQP